jgi:hypothetical protein
MIVKHIVPVAFFTSLICPIAWAQEPQSSVKPDSQIAAKPELVTSVTLESFQQIVQGMGFECTRDKDEKGNLESYIIFRAEGYKVAARVPFADYVYLFNIFTDKVPVEDVNEWNRGNSFSRASLGADKNLYLETEIPIRGGVTRDNIEAQIKTFRDSVVRWARFVIDHQKATGATTARQ